MREGLRMEVDDEGGRGEVFVGAAAATGRGEVFAAGG